MKLKTVLTIAGSDSIGGAGIQADLKTMLMNKVYGMSVITALTAQNTTNVYGVQPVSTTFLKQQMDAVFTDIIPNATKIGLVCNSRQVHLIAERLKHYDAKNIVVDPVMVTTSGVKFLNNATLKSLMKYLFVISTLITPNIFEAEIIANKKIKNANDMVLVAQKINQRYGCNVLLKGGHNKHDANDLLCMDGEITWFESVKIKNPNNHGTGCSLASAIAANLAKGFTVKKAIEKAKNYITNALQKMLNLGKGSGPIHHGFDLD